MAQALGKGLIFGMSGITVNFTGVASANIQGFRAVHGGQVVGVKGQSGNTEALHASDEMVENDFNIIPWGATVAAAVLTAALPPLLTAYTLAGFPVVTWGSFTNVFNTGIWIYKGGGEIVTSNEGHAAMSLKLTRHAGITSGTLIDL